jgi:hypothetical protein
MDDQMIDALVDELKPELLPEIIVNISDLIGYKAALKLINAFGGIRFEIPQGVQASRYFDALVVAIGADATEKLTRTYGGDMVYIPCCHIAFIKLRNVEFKQEVTLAVARGEVQTAVIHRLAPQYGFTERWAYKVLAAESAIDQLDLFD